MTNPPTAYGMANVPAPDATTMSATTHEAAAMAARALWNCTRIVAYSIGARLVDATGVTRVLSIPHCGIGVFRRSIDRLWTPLPEFFESGLWYDEISVP